MITARKLRKFALRVTIAAIGGDAAWISYWHMVAVATAGGEGMVAAHLYPLIVDGLMMVSTLVVNEDMRQRRRPRPWAIRAMLIGGVTSTLGNGVDAYLHRGTWLAYCVAIFPAVALYLTKEVLMSTGEPLKAPVRRRRTSGKVTPRKTPARRLAAISTLTG